MISLNPFLVLSVSLKILETSLCLLIFIAITSIEMNGRQQGVQIIINFNLNIYEWKKKEMKILSSDFVVSIFNNDSRKV